MRLLIDANLSPRVAEGLRSAGYDAGHVADLDMVTATDEQIFDRAVHVFQAFAFSNPDARRAVQEVTEFIKAVA